MTLGLTEIREFGATSVQIMRRLRALLEELLETVRPEHRAAVEDELRRLDATVADAWGDSVDLDRASEADRQGIGGPAIGRTLAANLRLRALIGLAPLIWAPVKRGAQGADRARRAGSNSVRSASLSVPSANHTWRTFGERCMLETGHRRQPWSPASPRVATIRLDDLTARRRGGQLNEAARRRRRHQPRGVRQAAVRLEEHHGEGAAVQDLIDEPVVVHCELAKVPPSCPGASMSSPQAPVASSIRQIRLWRDRACGPTRWRR